jgi:uncharacterized protein YbjT (DUF2867 family)
LIIESPLSMNKKYTALITGATGLIGKSCLQQLVEHGSYTKIIVIGRSEPTIRSEKIYFIASDLTDLETLDLRENIDHVYCCLGTTIKKAGSRADFRKVDFDFVVATAQLGLQHNASVFGVVSAIGADKDSSFAYNRVKGEMEETVASIGYKTVHIFQPSLLVGKREEFRFGEKVAEFFMTLFGWLLVGKLRKYRKIKGSTVASCMIDAALSGETGVIVHESDGMNQREKETVRC